MSDKPRKKAIPNGLLMALVIIVIIVVDVIIYAMVFSSSSLDISFEYTVASGELSGTATASTFASGLVVSENNVDMEGFELTNAEEKALLFEIESNNALYANGIYDLAYPASITKIMTAIVALKNGNMDDVVTMHWTDFELETGALQSNMVVGDQVTLKQLFELMLVYSANDAANAIARHISGSVEAFVEEMNEEAQRLGMIGTNFENPHGLHDDNHYTCAYDVYLMLAEAMNYSLFVETIGLASYTLDVTREDSTVSYYYESTDSFLTGLVGIPAGVELWGGKTGTTTQAGSCLALIAQNEEGTPYIAVLMNCQSKTVLYNDMYSLLSCISVS